MCALRRNGGTSDGSDGHRAVRSDLDDLSPGALALLRATRRRSGYSIDELAEAIGVRPRFLRALERGELGLELSPPYARSILARYALCLGLDPEAFVVGLDPRADCGWLWAPSIVTPGGMRRHRRRRHVMVAGVVAGLLGAAVYGAVQFGESRSAATK